MIHELMLKSDFVNPILSGDKVFEIRENDHGFQKGDRINFRVVSDKWTSQNKSLVNEIQQSTYVITYVISGWGLKEGYVAFGIKEDFK